MAPLGPWRLSEHHPLVTAGTVSKLAGLLPHDVPLPLCPGCQQCFEAGQWVTLVEIGPGEDEEARAAARDGRAYAAVAIPAHYACVTGRDEPPKMFRLVGLKRE